ncbi:TraR/DksA family transcriptional regulator [Chitinimonas arctica]|uniref:TraR/DksA family transcriptional regulator n=1 Tax=Chitinimonas arctica TaxID=2594795 RepID=A0A516SLY7_9NEIS|nr:TraR/DksA family transcriptional regulator [Chitinimonas arctica]
MAVSDEIDRANEIAQNHLDELIATQRAALHAKGTPECVDCGEDIPAARRVVFPAARCCIDCQTLRELRRRQGVCA